MRILSVIVAFLASGTLAAYVLTCSVNDTSPVPAHPIVGKWQLVSIGNNFSVGTYPNTSELTNDGRHVSETTNIKFGHVLRKGTYVVADDRVCFTQYGQPHSEDGDHHCVIAVLNAEQLILSSADGDTTNDTEYVRVHD